MYKKPVCNLLYDSKVAGGVGGKQEAGQGRIGWAVWCPDFTEASFMEIGMMREQKEGGFRSRDGPRSSSLFSCRCLFALFALPVCLPLLHV